MIAGAIAAFGAMAVLGALRSDLLRRAVGDRRLRPRRRGDLQRPGSSGSGGTDRRRHRRPAGRRRRPLGRHPRRAWRGIVAVALWLAFAQAPRAGSRTLAVSLDGPELRRASAARLAARRCRRSMPRAGSRRRKRLSTQAPARRARHATVHQDQVLPEPAPAGSLKAARGPAGAARGVRGRRASPAVEPVSRRPVAAAAAAPGVAPEAASAAVAPALTEPPSKYRRPIAASAGFRQAPGCRGSIT